MNEYLPSNMKDKSWYNLNRRIANKQEDKQANKPLLVKRKGQSWYKLHKQLKQQCIDSEKLREYGNRLDQLHKQGLSANTVSKKLSLRELKRLLKGKRERERKQAHTQALERERKRIHKNSPDMHKNRGKHRYYLYEGILYPKVNGKIPAKHQGN